MPIVNSDYAAVEIGHEVIDRGVARRRVISVWPGNGVEEDGGVSHAAGKGTHMVKRPGERDHSRLAHTTIGWFESHNAARGRRNPDASASVGSKSRVGHPSGDGDR